MIKLIKGCQNCPFKHQVYEQGFCGTTCKLLRNHSTIPEKGVLKNCPLKNEDYIIRLDKIVYMIEMLKDEI